MDEGPHLIDLLDAVHSTWDTSLEHENRIYDKGDDDTTVWNNPPFSSMLLSHFMRWDRTRIPRKQDFHVVRICGWSLTLSEKIMSSHHTNKPVRWVPERAILAGSIIFLSQDTPTCTRSPMPLACLYPLGPALLSVGNEMYEWVFRGDAPAKCLSK